MLDPRLKKVLTLWSGAATDGERQAARARAETMAAKAGMDFKGAVSAWQAEQSHGVGPINLFAGLDDFMEASEPGYKARRAAEKADKVAARKRRRDALISHHGSLEAALAPCERELLLLDAVALWRRCSPPPHNRWTHSVDGWSDPWKDAPPHVEAAIRGAYPLPQTFAEAQAEMDYWQQRDRDFADLLDDQYGDYALDLVARKRLFLIERLIDRDLEARTTSDVLTRLKLMDSRESTLTPEEQIRIITDLERVVALEAARASVQSVRLPLSVHREQIAKMLRSNSTRTDRSLARELGCSPTTVGKVRALLGLAGIPRSVQRGGQIFQGKYH